MENGKESSSPLLPIPSLLNHFCAGNLKEDLQPVDVNGRIISVSCNRFWLDIVPGLPNITKDRRSLADFLSIKIREAWTPPDSRKPILEYTQNEVVMVMEGLEWHLSGDIYFRERDPHWFREIIQALELVMIRCIFFYRQGELPVTILDDVRYCDVNTIEHTKVEVATVNYAFLLEMETLFTSAIMTCFEARCPIQMGPVVNTDALRTHIYAYSNYLGDLDLSNAWQEFYHGLITSKAHRAIHYFRVPHDVRPSMCTILSYKDMEISMKKFTTKSEILARHSDPMDDILTLDALFVMFCRSLRRKTGDPIASLVDSPSVPRITFSRAYGVWVLEPDAHQKIGFISISEAYVYFRETYPNIKQKGRTILDIKFS